MSGFESGTNVPAKLIGDETSARGTRYGRVLFTVYLVLYGGYVAITAFAPAIMKRVPVAGINLSVLYGLGLIIAAFLMALIYDWLCSATSTPTDNPPAGETR
jgi:uncharacterized membrane protein (DUF485 family)